MISMDRKIFDKNSAVAQRQIEYAKKYEEVHIIIFSDKSFTETTLGNNIFVYPTRSSSRWLYVFDALKLGRFIVEKRKITHVTCDNPFETGLVGALIKNRTSVHLELQVHTDIGSMYFQNFNALNKIRTKVSRYTFPRADHVRVVSNRIKDYLSTFIDPTLIEVRPIAVDVEKMKQAPIIINLREKYSQFSKIILIMSRLEVEKNVGMAIEAFAKVLEKIPSAGLVIVGSGSEDKMLKEKAKTLGIEKSIMFEGWQNETASYFKTADLLLNTSYYEGYGVIFKEAEAIGLPVVSTDVGIAQEAGAKIVSWMPEDIARGIMEVCSETKRQ